MAVRKDPFRVLEIQGSAAEFQKALASWPSIVRDRSARVVAVATQMARDEVVERTPLGATGKAKTSWYYVKLGPLSAGVVSFLIYIRRLEVGWGARRLGVRKGRRAAVARLTIAGRKMPIGGYRMMRDVADRMPQIIQNAAQRVLDEAATEG